MAESQRASRTSTNVTSIASGALRWVRSSRGVLCVPHCRWMRDGAVPLVDMRCAAASTRAHRHPCTTTRLTVVSGAPCRAEVDEGRRPRATPAWPSRTTMGCSGTMGRAATGLARHPGCESMNVALCGRSRTTSAGGTWPRGGHRERRGRPRDSLELHLAWQRAPQRYGTALRSHAQMARTVAVLHCECRIFAQS